ncbi:uncharacterized protein IL334_007412 [Kwoniella shivajii]|uniref:C2H2-type domain-containing protein n=1 Tax=Kwoniella shivajii TaxID=564305 RepID=A0ABZ1DAV4_9TREE|nr:hypothetical protein IL334_007412 [Kwoniella shivajii]
MLPSPPQPEQRSISSKEYQCTICPKKYARRDYLERHALNHGGPSSVCPSCGKGFARPDVLRKHQTTTCTAGVGTPFFSSTGSSSSASTDRISARKRKRRSSETLRGVRTPSTMAGHVTFIDPIGTWNGDSRGIQPQVTDAPMSAVSTSTTEWSASAEDVNLLDQALPLVTDGSDHLQSDLPDHGGTTVIAGEEFNWNSPSQTGDNMDDLLSWLFNPSPETSLLSTNQHNESQPLPINSDTVEASEVLLSPAPLRHPIGMGISSQAPPSRLRSTYPEPYIAHVPPTSPSYLIYPNLTERWSVWSPWQAPTKREILDEDARNAMLDLFDDNVKRELSLPSFSLQQMRLYLELYFMHFAPLYPIIHYPSLQYRRLPPDLLLAMICVGTAFANDSDGLEMASKLHRRLRTRIFETVEDEPTTSVASLQTILLLNHFARSYCSLKQHDIAQIFHSPIINLARQSGMLLPDYDRQLKSTLDDPVACWLEWVDEEERKRLGWFSFLMDTENAALYRGFLLIHCYSISIELPAPDEVWDAKDPLKWNRSLLNSSRPPSFRHALRELAGRGSIAPNLTNFSLWILLHGLHCVQWTLLWRDLGDLSMVHVSKITSWKDCLRGSFEAWRNHVEDTIRPQMLTLEHPMFSAAIPFSHLGTVLLLSDTEQVRIFAGTKKITGRPISPGEWAAANVYVNSWAKSQDAAYCCHSALQLLAHVFRWSSETRFQITSMVPWCVYVATLVVWSYGSALDGHDTLQAPFVIISPSRTSTAKHNVRIEPSLARKSALEYLDDVLSCEHPFALHQVKDKNKCAGIIAYTAYLAGTLKRGVMDECRTVLLGLLTEHV